MEKFVIVVIILIFLVSWISREKGEAFKYLKENTMEHYDDVTSSKGEESPSKESESTKATGEDQKVNEQVKKLYEEILSKFNIKTLSILNNYSNIPNFENKVRKWIEAPNASRTPADLISYLDTDQIESFSDPTSDQDAFRKIQQSQLPRISKGPYMYKDEIDIQEVPLNQPWQWIINNGPLRPWQPKYPLMTVPPEPIALLH